MKRLFYMFLLFFLLVPCLCACGKEEKPPFLEEGAVFDTDLTVLIGENRFKAHLVLDDKRATLTLQEPLKNGDVSFSLDENGQGSLSYEGLTFPIPKERLPEKGLLFDALRSSKEENLVKRRTTLDGQKVTLYSLVRGAENLHFYTDAKGRLLKITVEGETPLTVFFENQRQTAS